MIDLKHILGRIPTSSERAVGHRLAEVTCTFRKYRGGAGAFGSRFGRSRGAGGWTLPGLSSRL